MSDAPKSLDSDLRQNEVKLVKLSARFRVRKTEIPIDANIRQLIAMSQQHGILTEQLSDMAAQLEDTRRMQYDIRERLSEVKFVKPELPLETPATLEQLSQENERLKRVNAKLKMLVLDNAPHVRVFRMAIVAFGLCGFCFLSWLLFNIELIHPVFAVLGMGTAIGFMLMARAGANIAGKLKEKIRASHDE